MAEDRDENSRREAQARLDALLQEGLDSGPSTPMTAEDWRDIRREVAQAVKSPFVCADDSEQTAEVLQRQTAK